MILIVGLGNPGKEYAQTRHNFGFMVLDALAQEFETTFIEKNKFKAMVAECSRGSRKIILAKPLTFMNLSGEAVRALVQFYKINEKNIWIIADDLDLPLGKIRVRHGGESGGHHGLDSIILQLGAANFARLRLGVRGEKMRQDLSINQIDGNAIVMGNFMPDEQNSCEKTIALTVKIISDTLEQDELKAHTYEIEGFDSHAGDQ